MRISRRQNATLMKQFLQRHAVLAVLAVSVFLVTAFRQQQHLLPEVSSDNNVLLTLLWAETNTERGTQQSDKTKATTDVGVVDSVPSNNNNNNNSSSSSTSNAKLRLYDTLLPNSQDYIFLQVKINGAVISSRVYAEVIWLSLLEEASNLVIKNSSNVDDDAVVAMEVGAHSAQQCLQAAQKGIHVHCVEPSPKSFQRIRRRVGMQRQEDVRKRVHLHNVAASHTSQGTVPFSSSGSTGDHVGNFDVWKMEAAEKPAETGGAGGIQVPQMRLDDLIAKYVGDKDVFVLKVDVQGFEPAVFSGLSKSIKEHKIKYILTEYWPRGMDMLAGRKDQCVGADLLTELASAGYKLFALQVQAHPKAPEEFNKVKRSIITDMPLKDLRENCLWYFSLEERFPSKEYKMGYWSDVLAVAPSAQLENPSTFLGKVLQQYG